MRTIGKKVRSHSIDPTPYIFFSSTELHKYWLWHDLGESWLRIGRKSPAPPPFSLSSKLQEKIKQASHICLLFCNVKGQRLWEKQRRDGAQMCKHRAHENGCVSVCRYSPYSLPSLCALIMFRCAQASGYPLTSLHHVLKLPLSRS